MGCYIETDADKGKADYLIVEQGAIKLTEPPRSFVEIPEGKVLICVVENGPFDAAGVCCDEHDFDIFRGSDDVGPSTIERTEEAILIRLRSPYQEMGMQRPKTWLLLDRDNALVQVAMG